MYPRGSRSWEYLNKETKQRKRPCPTFLIIADAFAVSFLGVIAVDAAVMCDSRWVKSRLTCQRD